MELTLEKAFLGGEADSDGAQSLELHTDSGVIHCRYHAAKSGDAAVIWIFGSSGGLDGPAGGIYTHLAKEFSNEGIASVRLDYRHPGDIVPSVLDVFAAIYWLQSIGNSRVVLVGHSFGGAVAICAGAANPLVTGVAALSSQLEYADAVADLCGKSLLLIHGKNDEVSPHRNSEEIFRMADEPKEIRLYDCKHGLDDCRDQLDTDLSSWIRRTVPAPAGEPNVIE